jgi:hypothetical protein
MRGFLCAAMDKFPNDPQLLSLSSEQLQFMYYYKRKYMNDIRNDLGNVLGTRWSPESIHSPPRTKRPGDKEPEAYDIPLSLLIRPQTTQDLKKIIPKPKKGTKHHEKSFEEVFGKNLIREHQRRLIKEARELLQK